MEPINCKIIIICLRHYFCNVDYLKSDEEILEYYFSLINTVNATPLMGWEDLDEKYVVWSPFESMLPQLVCESMENLYYDIQNILDLTSPNVTVNSLELASSITEDLIKNQYLSLNKEYLVQEDNGDLRYSEEAQDDFNIEYQNIFEKINKSIV